ncbi:kynurenine 3-monooxygenase [Hydra vulgaris]|uniref:Kynurenine 3-monooxygenase n=1 Tax=Hydra vulgaris TaxID=6087 RepID=A0ABM4C330_HYDVU
MNEQKHVVIVGGGLVGSLEALFCAQRSYKVDVFEYRPDPRLQKYVAGKSINLALSERGRAALRSIGAEDYIVKTCIPMYARMMHSHNGKRTSISYGKNDQCILSVDRRKLNEHLITLAEKNTNISYHFQSKFVSSDFDQGKITFEKNGELSELYADLIVGCDGAYSAVRQHLLKTTRMNYSQFYIPHGYKEIEMLPNEHGEFAMEINYFHIWPRNEFMMIGLPNQDKSFTLTLFMPLDKFDCITSEQDIINFFEQEFPDSIPLIGRQKLIDDYKKNPVGDTICVKTYPYHYSDKVVILGDAAHATVPFYGQGMNCGFEDCLVLHEILDKTLDFKTGLEAYSKYRNPDAEALIDLSLYNYMELRAHVNSVWFTLRKKVDSFLQFLFPNTWIPLYSMVTFTRLRYHHVVERSKKQDMIVKWVVTGICVSALSVSMYYVAKVSIPYFH